ncbi:MAG: type IV pilus twitching motility protein PilT, partial [Chloroflexota bacterium]
MEMIDILTTAVESKASDIHLVVGRPPMIRTHGHISPVTKFPTLSEEDAKALVYSMLYQDQIARFEERLELDFSYNVPGLSRFRVNVLSQKNGIEAAMRLIPAKIPSPRELRLSDVVVSLTRLPRGLILVTGPTGVGKSTTLASLVDVVNAHRRDHILTIEDPIEYVHDHKNCIVRQREVGMNTHSFTEALRHALRQDPDVILVGEMRDL